MYFNSKWETILSTTSCCSPWALLILGIKTHCSFTKFGIPLIPKLWDFLRDFGNMWFSMYRRNFFFWELFIVIDLFHRGKLWWTYFTNISFFVNIEMIFFYIYILPSLFFELQNILYFLPPISGAITMQKLTLNAWFFNEEFDTEYEEFIINVWK